MNNKKNCKLLLKLKQHFKEWQIAFKYYIYRACPIQTHKIVFCNYNGKGYGCNPKYIAEELIKRHPKWDYVWLANDTNITLPLSVRCVKYDSAESIYELATAAVWIDNQRKLWYHRKRKKQFFIETWHGGGIPIKKIGADNPGNFNNKPYEHTSKHMNKIADMMISNSEACTEIFHRTFLYDRPILNCGYPRNDILVGLVEPYEKKIRKYFRLEEDVKLVLYAPTYRKGRELDKYTLDYDVVLDALTKKFGGNWKMLLKLHPTMRQRSEELKYEDNLIDASYYEDMQELLAGSNVLISDYSSVITEFAFTKKPVFLYATDISDYAGERDFYCDYYSLPFSIAQNNSQLVENIFKFESKTYGEGIVKCFEKFGIKESGNAAGIVADIIEEKIEKLEK